LKVIKKDGRVQPFDLSKIIFALERISDECSQPFTQSDLTFVAKNIEKSIRAAMENKDEDIIHTSKIRTIVIKELEQAGFKHIADCYKEYVKGFGKPDSPNNI